MFQYIHFFQNDYPYKDELLQLSVMREMVLIYENPNHDKLE